MQNDFSKLNENFQTDKREMTFQKQKSESPDNFLL